MVDLYDSTLTQAMQDVTRMHAPRESKIALYHQVHLSSAMPTAALVSPTSLSRTYIPR